MSDISNLKINERSNVERPNLPESLQWKIKIKNMTGRNAFIAIQDKYENQQNWKWCGTGAKQQTFFSVYRFIMILSKSTPLIPY